MQSACSMRSTISRAGCSSIDCGWCGGLSSAPGSPHGRFAASRRPGRLRPCLSRWARADRCEARATLQAGEILPDRIRTHHHHLRCVRRSPTSPAPPGVHRHSRPGAEPAPGRAWADPRAGDGGGARDRLPAGGRPGADHPAGTPGLRPAERTQHVHGPARRASGTNRRRAGGGGRARLHRVDGFSPDALAAAVRDLPSTSGGVGLIALDHPVVREAIRAAVARGLAVLTLVSDIANVPRIAYVGIDNRPPGAWPATCSAASSGLDQRGRAVRGLARYRGHEEREMGFRHILADDSRTCALRVARGPRRSRAQLPRGRRC